MHYIINCEAGHFNISPISFRRASADFLRAAVPTKTNTYSIVPYFMCCRAIELAFKAVHLESKSQAVVKMRFSHKLKESYDALPLECRILDNHEIKLLTTSSDLYWNKAFEYVQLEDIMNKYSRFPDFTALHTLAAKIVALAEKHDYKP